MYAASSRHEREVLDTLKSLLTHPQVHPAAAVYAASSQRELGSFEGSFATLSAAFNMPKAQEQPPLLVALGMECLYAGVCVCVQCGCMCGCG